MLGVGRSCWAGQHPYRFWLKLRVVLVASALLCTLGLSAQAASASPGQLFAFGSNFLGALGTTTNEGSTSPNATPALLSLPGATGQVVQTATGNEFSLVLTSTGQLYAFGYGIYGQLGSAPPEGGHSSKPTLVTLPGASGSVTQIAAGSGFSLVVTSSGQLFSFGENKWGQLGRETNAGTSTANPTPALVFLPGAVGPVVHVSGGNIHSLAITASGQLFAFGDNFSGELGNSKNNGSSNANFTPALVTLPGASGPVVQAAAGNSYSLAVTSTGQLFSFGYNHYGALGRTENSGTDNANPTPAPVSLPGQVGPVVNVSAGAEHSYALTASGQLYGFGSNHYGQLGTTTNAGTENPNPNPMLMSMPGPIVQIGGGNNFALAVTSNGQLLSLGQNFYGQLGRPTDSGTGNATPDPAPVELPPGRTIDTVSRGESSHGLVVTADIAVLTNTLAAGQVGVPYRAAPAASGGMGAYTWSANGLPAGLAIDPVSGQISGTPTTGGTASVVLRASDVFGVGASSGTIPLTIVGSASGPAGPVSKPAKPTIAQLKASLRSQLAPNGKAAKLASLAKKKSYTLAFVALSAGKLSINWYFLPKGAHISRKAKPVLFASGQLSFSAPGSKKITIKLTSKGQKLINGKASIKLTAKGSFTPPGQKAIVAVRSFGLHR